MCVKNGLKDNNRTLVLPVLAQIIASLTKKPMALKDWIMYNARALKVWFEVYAKILCVGCNSSSRSS